MNILAIDPSLRSLGLAWTQRNKLRFETIKSNSLESFQTAIGRSMNTIRKLHKINDFDLAIIEGYSYGSKGNATVTQGAVGGAIRALLILLKIPYIEIAPVSHKRIMFGKKYAGIKKTSKKDLESYLNRIETILSTSNLSSINKMSTSDEGDAVMLLLTFQATVIGKSQRIFTLRNRLSKMNIPAVDELLERKSLW